MCGIAGAVNISGRGFRPERIKPMCDIIAHRGPDDAGYLFVSKDGSVYACCDDAFSHLNPGLTSFSADPSQKAIRGKRWDYILGHRRLSIIDLSHLGHQPMSTPDKKIWIVYNGEIYNFPELKKELQASGCRFRSRTDTEVLLYLYEKYGAEMVNRLNGMFAFAILDLRKRSVFCARDRYGIKPFYYILHNGYFIFGSEIKAILASGSVEPEMNLEAVNEYFTFQNIYSYQTMFDGVKLLPPASTLTVDLRQPAKGISIKRYWDYDFFRTLRPEQISEKECASELADIIQRSVKSQLVSDVPVGSYLSGGMDSGALVALSSRIIKRLHTFTNGFDLTSVSGIEQGFDERAVAEKVANRFGTEHYEMVIHSGDMAACLPRLVWHLEDLKVGNCYQNYYAAKLASRFIKVCLSGTGGDELFAGYPWRYYGPLEAANAAVFNNRYFKYWQRLVPDDIKKNFFSAAVWKKLRQKSCRGYYDDVLSFFGIDHTGNLKNRLLNRALYFELKTFLPGLLTVEDRLSMSHSMEVRVPFLDNEVVDYALRIPNEYKLRDLHYAGTKVGRDIECFDGKMILRKAMEKYLPRDIVSQKKQGFSPPDDNWYRGVNMKYIKDILFDNKTASRPYFNQAMVKRYLDEHFAGKVNHRLLIWSLICFEWLQRLYYDKNISIPDNDRF